MKEVVLFIALALLPLVPFLSLFGYQGYGPEKDTWQSIVFSLVVILYAVEFVIVGLYCIIKRKHKR